MRVAIIVARAAGDHAESRLDLIEKRIAGGGPAAMMPHFQDVGMHVHSFLENGVFAWRLRVSSEEKRGGAEIEPCNDGHVVEIVILLAGAENGQRRALPTVGFARCGRNHLCAGILDSLQEIFIGLCRGRILLRQLRHDDIGNRNLLQNVRHAANMIGMRMRCNHIVEAFDILRFEIGENCLPVPPLARIDEYVEPLGLDQDGISLSNVDIMDGKRLLRRL